MKDSLDIKKFVEGIIKHQQGLSEKEVMSPEREWLLGITMTLGLLLLGAWLSLDLNYRVTTSGSSLDNVSPVAVPYEARLIDEVEADYAAKADVYNKIKGSAEIVPVPEVETIEAPVIEEVVPSVESTEGVIEPAELI